MGEFFKDGSALVYRFDGETLRVEPWGRDSVRVRGTLMREPDDKSYALLTPATSESSIELDGNRAVLRNGKIVVSAEINGWSGRARLEFRNSAGKLLLREIAEGGALQNKPRFYKPILGGDFKLTASFDSDRSEKLYGMGQYQQDIFNLKGCNLELAHRNSQASVPFYISSLGYGFLWHNPAVGRVSFGLNRTEWYADATDRLDYWITSGDTPSDIISNYADATGHAPMMPSYGLGFWQCKLRYWNQEQLLSVAREYAKRDLKLDVIVVDFFHWPYMGDYRFDEQFFPDPKAMCEELRSLGIKLMVSVWPQVDLRSENYAEMRDKGLLIRPDTGVPVAMLFCGNSTFFDATNPEAREYLWQKCKENYFDKGVTLFWLDEAEPEFATYDYDAYRCHAGPYLRVGNAYPQLYSRAFYDGMSAETGSPNVVNLVRCAWAGSQRYGALVWSGDVQSTFEDFRKQLAAGLHMGLSGIPWWTTDIGGFTGGDPDDPAFRELMIRWFQWGTFCPVMRLHGDRRPSSRVYAPDGTPQACNTGADNEVWSYGEEAYPILVKYMGLRETLRPYTESLMREAHESGAPVMRTMFYEFLNDPVCWDIGDQYMFGAKYLVAPVMYAGARSRSVYLPNGTWRALDSGETFEGGRIIEAAAPLDVIPVFEKL